MSKAVTGLNRMTSFAKTKAMDDPQHALGVLGRKAKDWMARLT